MNPLQNGQHSEADPAPTPESLAWCPAAVTRWLHSIDPGAHRRIKGLRLVTAFGIAAMLGTRVEIVQGLPDGVALNSLAGGFALWASVSEGRSTRAESTRDLVLLSTAAALGAVSFIFLAPLLQHLGHAGPELTLVTGAFLVGYLRRFVILAVSGDHSIPLLASRAWETFLGGVLGLVMATLLLPLRTSET
jgi:hypothetical protein